MADEYELTGRVIGGYKLEQFLGAAAMGPVYASTHRDTGQRAAVKIIPSGHLPARALVERFSNDHKLLKTIVHPGLLNIYDAGKIAGVGYYLATELLEGKPLPALIAAAPTGMPITQALLLAEGICSALAAAHDVGILHRNVRPSNVFVIKAGKRLQVKLLDFGVPGLAPLAGSHDYRAPEQLPQAPINEGADLYSTGLILFELLTGRKVSHADDPPPPPSQHRAEISAALDGLVLEVLARFPESRPGSAKSLRDQLTQLRADLPSVSQEVLVEPKTLPGRPGMISVVPTELRPSPARPRPPLSEAPAPAKAAPADDPKTEIRVPSPLKSREPVAPPEPGELLKRIAAGVLALVALVAGVWFWRQPIKHYTAEDEPLPAAVKSKAPAFDPGAPMTDDELSQPAPKPAKPKHR